MLAMYKHQLIANGFSELDFPVMPMTVSIASAAKLLVPVNFYSFFKSKVQAFEALEGKR
jgi:hypothetical protein